MEQTLLMHILLKLISASIVEGEQQLRFVRKLLARYAVT